MEANTTKKHGCETKRLNMPTRQGYELCEGKTAAKSGKIFEN